MLAKVKRFLKRKCEDIRRRWQEFLDRHEVECVTRKYWLIQRNVRSIEPFFDDCPCRNCGDLTCRHRYVMKDEISEVK